MVQVTAGGDMALDANEETAYFRLENRDLASRLPEGTKIAEPFGPRGMGAGPAGLAGMNLRSGEIKFIGQVPAGDPGRSIWHVAGSADGRWAAADDFQYRLWLIDRHSGEMILLSDNGHKRTASDHQHPTFNADGTKIEIQSAMLSEDGRALNICIVPVPKSWLARTYPGNLVIH